MKLDRDIKISTVGRDDYPELEGIIIEFEYSNGRIIKGIVVGCNRSVGITIVSVKDKNNYLVCFAGPVTPDGGMDFNRYKCTYDEFFEYTIGCIREGYINSSKMTLIHSPEVSAGHCSGHGCAYR